MTDVPADTVPRWPPDVQESTSKQITGWLVAVGIAALFLFTVLHFLSSTGHEGLDQSGYLVAGKVFARSGGPGVTLSDPREFVGVMWVYIDRAHTLYPKYPLGLPLIYAACLRLFGDTPGGAGYIACYLVSPVMSAFALLGLYALTRRLAGVFAGWIAMLLLASCEYSLPLAYNPNSHATSLCLTTWGVAMLLRYVDTRRTIWGFLASLVIGYAGIVRYTDAMMLLPLGVACAMTSSRTSRRSWIQTAAMLFIAILPVASHLLYNRARLGVWTSYAQTNESTAFSLDNLTGDWERTLRLLNDDGMYCIGALGLLGILVMLALRWRTGVLFALFTLPPLLLYASYYWAPLTNIVYGRFFFAQFPIFIAAACWAMSLLRAPAIATRRARAAPIAGIGAVALVACAIPAMRTARAVNVHDFWRVGHVVRSNALQAQLTKTLLDELPHNAVVFTERERAHNLRFLTDFTLFDASLFSFPELQRLVATWSRGDNPTDLDPGQVALWRGLVDGKSQRDFNADFDRLVTKVRADGRRVFAVMEDRAWREFRDRVAGARFDYRELAPFIETPSAPTAIERMSPDDRPPHNNGAERRPGGREERRTLRIVEITPRAS